jgi:hypothetical protein
VSITMGMMLELKVMILFFRKKLEYVCLIFTFVRVAKQLVMYTRHLRLHLSSAGPLYYRIQSLLPFHPKFESWIDEQPGFKQ